MGSEPKPSGGGRQGCCMGVRAPTCKKAEEPEYGLPDPDAKAALRSQRVIFWGQVAIALHPIARRSHA